MTQILAVLEANHSSDGFLQILFFDITHSIYEMHKELLDTHSIYLKAFNNFIVCRYRTIYSKKLGNFYINLL